MVRPNILMATALCLFGCSSVTFPYKFYKPELASWSGKLLGDKPADDLDATACQPEGACVVMEAGAFFQLKLDYEDMQQRLQACGGMKAL